MTELLPEAITESSGENMTECTGNLCPEVIGIKF